MKLPTIMIQNETTAPRQPFAKNIIRFTLYNGRFGFDPRHRTNGMSRTRAKAWRGTIIESEIKGIKN